MLGGWTTYKPDPRRLRLFDLDVKILSNLKSFDCQAYGQKAVYMLMNFYLTFFLFLVHTSLYYKVIARRSISTDINFPKVSSWQVVVDQYKSQKLRSCTDDSFQQRLTISSSLLCIKKQKKPASINNREKNQHLKTKSTKLPSSVVISQKALKGFPLLCGSIQHSPFPVESPFWITCWQDSAALKGTDPSKAATKNMQTNHHTLNA